MNYLERIIMTQIAIVNGSVQEKNYTGFALSIIKREIEKHKNFSVIEVNLKDFNLPFPGEKIKNDDSPNLRKTVKIRRCIYFGNPRI